MQVISAGITSSSTAVPYRVPSPILRLPPERLKFLREVHKLKTLSPISVTVSGIVMLTSEVHSQKARLPMEVTFEKSTSLRLAHPAKRPSGMCVMCVGILTFSFAIPERE